MIDGILSRLRYVEELVRQRASDLVWFEKITRSSKTGDDDAVDGQLDDRDGEGYQYPARRIEPWGVRWRAPTGVLGALLKAVGGASSGLLLGIATKKYGPQDLEEGEVALYCVKDGALVKLAKVGKVEIKSADDEDVVVNDGTLKVARDTDPIDAGTLTGQAGPFTVVFTHVDSRPPNVSTAGPTVALTGKITDGAPRFKG